MMKKLSLLSRITFALFLLLSVATLTGCAALKTSPDVDDKRAEVIKPCYEGYVRNHETDKCEKSTYTKVKESKLVEALVKVKESKLVEAVGNLGVWVFNSLVGCLLRTSLGMGHGLLDNWCD
jgi:hypothetical protein